MMIQMLRWRLVLVRVHTEWVVLGSSKVLRGVCACHMSGVVPPLALLALSCVAVLNIQALYLRAFCIGFGELQQGLTSAWELDPTYM